MDKKKILLVDDVQLFLEREKSFFNREQFTLLLARSGLEAIGIVREERPDLVFMDLHMKEMDGDKCCHIIKSDGELSRIPIIIVTDGVDEEEFERSWSSGCDDIIVKPINRLYFQAITKKYLHIQVRKTPRHIARLRVRFGHDQENLLTDYAINVSTGGVFIETDTTLPVDTILAVEFILPQNVDTIRCNARVAWLNRPEQIVNPNLPIGMGLQFVNISPNIFTAHRETHQ
jgi:uncharacterized protein (TIGR02266 family)